MEWSWKPRNKPYIYHQLIFNKGARATDQEKNSIFNKWYGVMDIQMKKKKMKLDSYLSV